MERQHTPRMLEPALKTHLPDPGQHLRPSHARLSREQVQNRTDHPLQNPETSRVSYARGTPGLSKAKGCDIFSVKRTAIPGISVEEGGAFLQACLESSLAAPLRDRGERKTSHLCRPAKAIGRRWHLSFLSYAPSALHKQTPKPGICSDQCGASEVMAIVWPGAARKA